MQHRRGRGDADGCLPVFLQVRRLRHAYAPQTGRLLCVLLLRLSAMPACPGVRWQSDVLPKREGRITAEIRPGVQRPESPRRRISGATYIERPACGVPLADARIFAAATNNPVRFLLGAWQLMRLGRDGVLGRTMRLRGTASFSACAAEVLPEERGSVAFGTYRGEAARRYVFRLRTADRASVCFEDGRLFHCLDLTKGVALGPA